MLRRFKHYSTKLKRIRTDETAGDCIKQKIKKCGKNTNRGTGVFRLNFELSQLNHFACYRKNTENKSYLSKKGV